MTVVDYYRLIIAAVLAMARLAGAFAICPAMTDAMIPGVARRAAVLGFSVLSIPMIMDQMPAGMMETKMLCFLGFREALLGWLIGFFVAIPFWIAENVGNFIDNQRGATMGEVYSPLSGGQVSTLGIFFTQIVSTLFFIGGGILVMLGALYKSYTLWPVMGDWGMPVPNAPVQMLVTLDSMLQTTIVIAAPVIIVMFLATLGLGLVNRTAPQLNVFFLSMPVKSALGIAMLVIYLPFIMDMLLSTKEAGILEPVRHLFQ